MVATRDDLNPLITAAPSRHTIDHSVLARDAARPPTREIALERLRLAEAREWVTASILDQFIDSPQRIGVVAEPVLVVFPGERGEADIHRPEVGFASWR